MAQSPVLSSCLPGSSTLCVFHLDNRLLMKDLMEDYVCVVKRKKHEALDAIFEVFKLYIAEFLLI